MNAIGLLSVALLIVPIHGEYKDLWLYFYSLQMNDSSIIHYRWCVVRVLPNIAQISALVDSP